MVFFQYGNLAIAATLSPASSHIRGRDIELYHLFTWNPPMIYKLLF